MKRWAVFLFPCLLCLGLVSGLATTAGAAAEDLYYRPEAYGLDWTAIKLFAAGAVLLFMELFIPGFGICGISGIVCILASFYFALGGSKDTIPVLAAGVVGLFVIGSLLMKFLPQNPVWKKLALSSKTTELSKAESKEQSSYVGKKGKALSLLRPSGVALIEGKRVDVLTEGEFIPEDSALVVVKVEGRKIFVEEEK